MSRLLLLIAAGTAALFAQAPVSGPSLGVIFDANGGTLRPILGVPGASVFGDPLTASTLASAAISLRQNVAIANDGAWKAIGLGKSASATPLPGGLPASVRPSVSENGTAAAFYDGDGRTLTVVSGIGTDVMAANPVNLDALPGPITRLATADDGSLLLAASTDAGGEALLWIAADGSARTLATLQSTASILLWNRGGSAIVVDGGANQVFKIQDPGGNAAITLLASDADGVSNPSGAALSSDGKQLWIGNKGADSVLGIDLSSRTALSLPCGFDVTTLVPLGGTSIYRLNEPASGPLWLLDTSPGTGPRVVFVPALTPPVNDQEVAQ